MTSLTVTKASRWRSEYEVRSADGDLAGTLRVRGVRWLASAEIGGETYAFRPTGFLRRRVAVTAQRTGEQVARVEGKNVLLPDGRRLRRARKGLVDTSGAPVEDEPLLVLLAVYLKLLDDAASASAAASVGPS
jgi:hypothetical protein